MNKLINTNSQGGLPFTQYTLGFMQDSYKGTIGALASAFGSKIILTGVQSVGANYSPGWVVIDGELMPFRESLATGFIGLGKPETESRTYSDGQIHDVYTTKFATSVVSGGTAYAEFVKMDSLALTQQNLKQTNDALTALKNVVDGIKPSTVPTGTIVMWSGAVNVLPVGWALCDGQSGRPDLRGRFVVGYNPYDTDYNAINKTGGEKTHVLSISEMPSHNHADLEGDDTSHGGNSASINGPARWLVSALASDTKNAQIPNSKTGYTGGSQPHENRPPYYTLAYIIKL